MLWLAATVQTVAQPGAVPRRNAAAAATQHLRRSEQLLPLNPAAALLQGEQALHLAAVGGPPAAVGSAYLAMGAAYQAQRQYDAALRHFVRALRLYQQLHDESGRARALRMLGRAQYLQGDTGQAYDTYKQALAITLALRDPRSVAQVYGNLGELLGAGGQWQRALRSHEQAYSEWQQAGNLPGQAQALNAIGLAHHQLRQYSRSLYYLRLSLQQARQLGDSTSIGEALASTGRVYQDVGNYEVAMGFYTQAISQLPHYTPPARRAAALQALALVQDSMANRPAAIRALRQALPLARQAGSQIQVSTLYQKLADLYQRENNYPLALAAQRRYSDLQDSVFAERRSAQIAELQTRYETEKKGREIQLLLKNRQIQDANLHRQKLLRNTMAVGALLLLLTVAALYRGRREQARVNRLLQRKNRAINRQKQELSHLNRTKDTLFSIISHDLRSPLSSLYSMLTLQTIGNLPPERMAAHTQRLSRTLDVTLRLLDNLLNWSAAQMQGDKVRPEKVVLQTAVEEALALLAGDAERKNIELRTQLPAHCLVSADVNMLRLVLRNLVGNAIKFTPAEGNVTISARLREAGVWEIAVADTGVGIAVPDQARLFGEDGLHSTLGTAHEKGTGLGLRLCKEFVERNGGRISFESVLGQGTTFWFTLPAAPEAPGPPAPAVPAIAAAAG
ncbi:ATP-binding protein [Hymenobacter yonginensis]|uniref:histidine kinase n=1 Tax=Hymenobacter yonginensis TaxID=748197 RepID=A0ABY7PPS0_9BACT|nr:tetratricopeptide repeat-containing sensor histidine kinase [Hymenobacter yonginensis]WBO85263.1 tetratricopeptide repeat-containing sensor histidine kinase [Hymenobacter yonginensis]